MTSNLARSYVEFGNIPVGTRFTIDSNGVTFEKTSEREAKIVAGDIRLIGVKSQFGLSKPVLSPLQSPRRGYIHQ